MNVDRKMRGPDSLLEEMSLAQGEFGELGQPMVSRDQRVRLTRSHTSIALEVIVKEPTYQSRTITFDPENFPEDAELLKSVKTHGVLEPVYLERIPADMGDAPTYRPIAGHRRLAAARMAGLEHIDAIIARGDDDIRAIALAENIGHRNLTPYEKAIGLEGLKSSHDSLSLRNLAKKSGIPFGTVSSLIAAYEKSSPVLRRMFAEGLAPRTIQELQPVFAKVQEDIQINLAQVLAGATQSQSASFRQMAESDIDPIAAARSAMGFSPVKSGRSHERGAKRPEQAPKDGKETKPSSGEKPRPKKRRHNSIPEINDDASIVALSNRTCAPKAAIKRLIQAAQRTNTDYSTLTLACAYVAGGGNSSMSLKLANKVVGNRKAAIAIFKHLANLERARILIANEKDDDVVSFLKTIFFGA